MNYQKIKYIFLFCLMCFALGRLSAQDSKSLFQTANSYYQNKQFDEAEKMYNLLLLKDKNNANAYYNLGNTYYHLKQYPNAILNYEKAKKIQPDNKYINRNIELTNNKLFSKIEFSKEFFIAKELKNVAHTKSSATWSYFLLVALWLSALSFCIYFFNSKNSLFRIGSIALLFTFFFSYLTYSAYQSEQQHNYAIVLQQNAYLQKSPVENTDTTQFIQAGLKVRIIDDDKNWVKVKLPNDKIGWLQKNSIALI